MSKKKSSTLPRKLMLTAILPLAVIWNTVSAILAILLAVAYIPRYIIVKRMYWAVPFAAHVFRPNFGWVGGFFVRQAFEFLYSVNVLRRLISSPFRRRLPDLYILGFPKSGTTSLANHLRDHPAMLGVDGIPFHDVLRKESHFLVGVLGRYAAHQAWLYRAFFPTVIAEWFAECVRGVTKSLCFDACPVYSCLPHTAERIRKLTPDAKLVFMIREPVSFLFSSEIMLRNMGFDVPWTLMDQYEGPEDPRLAVYEDEERLWKSLEQLKPEDPLPEDMPSLFYTRIGMGIRSAQIIRGVRPFVERFPPENIMFISFDEFRRNEEAVVREVLSFVGADPKRYTYTKKPPGMKSDYKGRQVHPSMKVQLSRAFAPWNKELFRLIGQTLDWADEES